jgi:hypothetical protein
VKEALKGRSGEDRKQFFFEKKNQKTFVIWCALPDGGATKVQKFFASFFQKRSPSLHNHKFRRTATSSKLLRALARAGIAPRRVPTWHLDDARMHNLRQHKTAIGPKAT